MCQKQIYILTYLISQVSKYFRLRKSKNSLANCGYQPYVAIIHFIVTDHTWPFPSRTYGLKPHVNNLKFINSLSREWNCYYLNLGATSIECYQRRHNRWSKVANMTSRRLQFGVAVIDSKLFVVGGRDGLKTLNSVECFNTRTMLWSSMPPVATHRHGLGMLSLVRKFY